MDRDARTRIVGAFISIVDERDPGWMIRDLNADDCMHAHKALMDLDGRLKRQYAVMGGDVSFSHTMIEHPPTTPGDFHEQL